MPKTIDVRQLEGDLAAANALIRQVAEVIGVKFKPVTQANAVEHTAKFVAALSAHASVKQTGRTLSGDGLQQFDDEDLDDEIDRANADGGSSRAIVPRANQNHGPSNDLLEQIGHELGVNLSGLTTSDGLEVILQELQRIKGSGDVEGSGPASKGDTLAEAMAHNARTSRHTDSELARNRAIVNRVAAALQIAQWDADGTEIIEIIQRFQSFKYILQARVKELEKQGKDEAAGELSTQLAVIMGSSAYAQWLKNKPAKTVNAVVAALAVETKLDFREFLAGDIIRLHKVLEESPNRDALTDWLRDDFKALAGSVTASTEFCRLMNLVVLPLLAKQGALLPNRIPRQ